MNTIVIGAGASGLTAAIYAARQGGKVTLIEHTNKIGKKILVTGNGKCNITNKDLSPNKYYGDKQFVGNVLDKFGYNETLEFFKEIGVLTKDNKGYIYPLSEQAITVLNALREQALSNGVIIKTNNEVKQIKKYKDKDKFIVDVGIELTCDYLIIATGGMAMPQSGSDGSGYELAQILGHTIIKPSPALTALLCKDSFLNKGKGIRVNARIEVMYEDNVIACDMGELQITDYGISGIPVFNISHLADKDKSINIDFMPQMSEQNLKNELQKLFTIDKKKTLVSALNGILNDKLASIIIQSVGLNDKQKACSINNSELTKIADKIKKYRLTVSDRRGFQYAQVTKGGVDTDEINPETMESKLVKNLFFAGEIINVDGICGGYNLQFAWATGSLAGGNCH